MTRRLRIVDAAPARTARSRAELIEDIERQLKTKAQCETVFTIRWVLADTLQT
jgi:hypothetical protein